MKMSKREYHTIESFVAKLSQLESTGIIDFDLKSVTYCNVNITDMKVKINEVDKTMKWNALKFKNGTSSIKNLIQFFEPYISDHKDALILTNESTCLSSFTPSVHQFYQFGQSHIKIQDSHLKEKQIRKDTKALIQKSLTKFMDLTDSSSELYESYIEHLANKYPKIIFYVVMGGGKVYYNFNKFKSAYPNIPHIARYMVKRRSSPAYFCTKTHNGLLKLNLSNSSKPVSVKDKTCNENSLTSKCEDVLTPNENSLTSKCEVVKTEPVNLDESSENKVNIEPPKVDEDNKSKIEQAPIVETKIELDENRLPRIYQVGNLIYHGSKNLLQAYDLPESAVSKLFDSIGLNYYQCKIPIDLMESFLKK